MSVEIDPPELDFRRPFTVEVSRLLKIKNPNSWPVAFKVKTTAPKQYCVRPNSGRIEPGHDVEVSVLLQAMKQEPPLETRCRDKFLVQSVTITGDKEFVNVTQIWDSVVKASVQERKIRVNWLTASGEASHNDVATTPARRSNGAAMGTPDDRPAAYSPPPAEETTAVDIIAKPEPEPVTAFQLKKLNPKPPPPADTPVSTAATRGSSSEGSDQPKAAELAASQADNRSSRGSESELRQRKGASTQASSSTNPPRLQQQQAVRQGTEGVPVQIVALLCLLSFLLAYFLF